MRLPIDTTTVKFAAAGPAEPVLDFETRQPKTEPDSMNVSLNFSTSQFVIFDNKPAPGVRMASIAPHSILDGGERVLRKSVAVWHEN